MKHIFSFLVRTLCTFGLMLPFTSSFADQDQVRQSLQTALPQYTIGSIEWHEQAGMYKAEVKGGPTLYVTKNAQYFVVGDLYRVAADGLVNETEQAKLAKLESLPESDMVVFKADNEKTHITVFTDVDCGYCRMLHNDVPILNEMGITVRYLAYPRAGIGSLAYRKMVSIWCSDDPKKWITEAKMGAEVPENKCVNPVAEQYQLGVSLGVRGTPSIISKEGVFMPGYLPPKELASKLGL